MIHVTNFNEYFHPKFNINCRHISKGLIAASGNYTVIVNSWIFHCKMTTLPLILGYGLSTRIEVKVNLSVHLLRLYKDNKNTFRYWLDGGLCLKLQMVKILSSIMTATFPWLYV